MKSNAFLKSGITAVLIGMTFLPLPLFGAVMQSSNYSLELDSANAGGVRSSSASYALEDTAGETGTGRLTSSTYVLRAGYQQTTAEADAAPEPEVEAPTSPGGTGPIVDQFPRIENVQVKPAERTATIVWDTNKLAYSKIEWGKTLNYESGSVSDSILSKEHEVLLSNLTPGTRYYFRITALDSSSKSDVFFGSFVTLSPFLPQIDLVPNPSQFVIAGYEDHLNLSWKNPIFSAFDSVRVMRSTSFFPETPFQGTLVYEGRAEGFVDREVEKQVMYFYTIFARDTQGRYSSGVIAVGKTAKPGEAPLIIREPFLEFPDSLLVHPQLQELTLADFDFIQDGVYIYPEGNTIPIDGEKSLTISIDYEKLPEVLKTIGITLEDPDDSQKTFSFLLRVGPDKRFFRATIAPLGKSGAYGMSINILDHKNQGIKKLAGSLLASIATAVSDSADDITSFGYPALFLLLLLLLLALMAFLLLKRQRESEHHPASL